ncbi:MAG: hypothetical protein ACYDBB_00940 [Armatimonadota bacterium]
MTSVSAVLILKDKADVLEECTTSMRSAYIRYRINCEEALGLPNGEKLRFYAVSKTLTEDGPI